MTAILRCRDFEVKIPSKFFGDFCNINNYYFCCLATCLASVIGEIENFITRLCELQEHLFYSSWSRFSVGTCLFSMGGGGGVLGQAVGIDR
jgi:hypothetical protein